jgi:hypothetical protein
MPLSLSQRWKPHRIEAAVRRSDPRLAALLAIFTRLAAQDAMPLMSARTPASRGAVSWASESERRRCASRTRSRRPAARRIAPGRLEDAS